MRVLLVSTYELGHQPLHLASPAAALLAAGHEVRCVDLAVQDWARVEESLDWAGAVGFSVPMHTAMRLAVGAARRVRAGRPGLAICFYGLYAGVSQDLVLGSVADQLISGEYEPALAAWVASLDGGGGGGQQGASVELGRGGFQVPARHLLPPLERYARLVLGSERRLAGYVEATHGCSHRCGHCPVPVVYRGRTRKVDAPALMCDVGALVGSGARHLSFGDPDFLNRPEYALGVARAVHSEFPQLSFDVTVKVTHILAHRSIWAEMAGLGCLFVVSAFESTDDAILERLGKGHTLPDARRATRLLRAEGIEVRPSWLAFTPWSTAESLAGLVEFVAAEDLIASVDPVQYSIRLLLPEGSLLVGRPDLAPHLERYDPEALSWLWRHPDPDMDALQARLARLAEEAWGTGEDPEATFGRVWEAVAEVTGGALSVAAGGGASIAGRVGDSVGDRARPRLSEPWFCCAEPTSGQLGRLERV